MQESNTPESNIEIPFSLEDNTPEYDWGNPSLPKTYRRFHRQVAHDFAICINVAKKGHVFIDIEDFHQHNYTFFYALYGRSLQGKLFDPNPRVLTPRKIFDYQEYWDDAPGTHPGFITQILEDSFVVGFSVVDNTLIWEPKLLLPEDEIKTISMPYEKNILVCMTGNLTIEGNTYNRYDYLRLEKNKEYVVDEWNAAEVGIFSVVGKR